MSKRARTTDDVWPRIASCVMRAWFVGRAYISKVSCGGGGGQARKLLPFPSSENPYAERAETVVVGGGGRSSGAGSRFKLHRELIGRV